MKWKLTVAVSLLVAAISILMAAGMYHYMKRDYLTAINNNRIMVVNTLATSAFEALLREDMSSIAFLAEQFVKRSDVLAVMVLDQGDKVMYDSKHQLEGKIYKGGKDIPYTRRTIVDGNDAVEVTVPFKIGDKRWSTALVVYSMAPVNREIALLFKIMLLFGALGMVAGVVMSSVLARWITTPIEELTKGMNAVEEGDLDYRIRIESRDELERVGDDFNSMAERLKEVQNKLIQSGAEVRVANLGLLKREEDLATKNFELQDLNSRLQSFINALEESHKKLKEAQAELLEKEKMAAILELAGAAAHEINQPLTIIIGNIDLLLSKERIDEAEGRKTLAAINRAAREMAGIVKKMAGIRRYVTGSYVGNIRILDLDKSSREQ